MSDVFVISIIFFFTKNIHLYLKCNVTKSISFSEKDTALPGGSLPRLSDITLTGLTKSKLISYNHIYSILKK